MVIGSWASGTIVDRYVTPDNLHDWQSIWLMPAGMALLVMLGFLFFFR